MIWCFICRRLWIMDYYCCWRYSKGVQLSSSLICYYRERDRVTQRDIKYLYLLNKHVAHSIENYDNIEQRPESDVLTRVSGHLRPLFSLKISFQNNNLPRFTYLHGIIEKRWNRNFCLCVCNMTELVSVLCVQRSTTIKKSSSLNRIFICAWIAADLW